MKLNPNSSEQLMILLHMYLSSFKNKADISQLLERYTSFIATILLWQRLILVAFVRKGAQHYVCTHA